MAKSFDRVKDESAINYNFFRAQIVIIASKQLHAPPPFFVLTLISVSSRVAFSWLFACVRWLFRRLKRCMNSDREDHVESRAAYKVHTKDNPARMDFWELLAPVPAW